MLTDRGYRLVAFENVLGRSLDAYVVPFDGAGIEVRFGRRTDVSRAAGRRRRGRGRLAHHGRGRAVVTTAPGSKSQQNVQRQGFHLLYTRAVLVK